MGPILKSEKAQQSQFIRSFYEPCKNYIDSDSEDEYEIEMRRQFKKKQILYDEMREKSINKAMETVRKSKDFIARIETENERLKSQKINQNQTEFGEYLSKFESNLDYYRKKQNLLNRTNFKNDRYDKRQFYPRETFCDFRHTKDPSVIDTKIYRKRQTLGGPSCYKECIIFLKIYSQFDDLKLIFY